MNLKAFLIALLLAAPASCATAGGEVRQYNANGTPRPLPGEMELGRQLCQQKCQAYGRTMKEYEPTGDCDCNPITYGNQRVPSNQL